MAANPRATTFGPARDEVPQRSDRAARHIPGVQFIREVRSELRKVVWPTREEATRLTIVVIAVSAATGLILGGFDYALQQAFTLLH